MAGPSESTSAPFASVDMSELTTKSAPRGAASDSDHTPWIVVSSRAGVSTMALPRRDEIVIGRAAGCDVVIDDDSISRRHAALRAHRFIRDLGSRNGTTVMGSRLTAGQEAAITVGTVVELGTVTVVVLAGQPMRSSKPPERRATAVVRDPTMMHLYGLADVIAASPLAVLLLGETGTGKDVFAEALHARSPRARGPMLRLNCAGLTGSLLEAELFGYERGAFTGATTSKPGLFEAASGGTMFLDEVGDLPLDTQAKLLRVLETGEVFRLGSLKPRQVDVRYVAATNRDVEGAVAQGLFRRDLLFRLNGFSLTLPPLRRRTSEILPLAEHFLAESVARQHGGRVPSLGPAACRALLEHPFPGNVRELKQLMERGVALVRDGTVIEPEHLWPAAPPAARRWSRSFDLGREEIEDALRRTNGNQTRAAELLGVARRTLIKRIEAHGVARPRKKETR